MTDGKGPVGGPRTGILPAVGTPSGDDFDLTGNGGSGVTPAGGIVSVRGPTLRHVVSGRAGVIRRIGTVEKKDFFLERDVQTGRLTVSGSFENGTIQIHRAVLEIVTTGFTRGTFLSGLTRVRYLTSHTTPAGWVLLEGTIPTTSLDSHRLLERDPRRHTHETVFFGLEKVGAEIRLIPEGDARILGAYHRARAEATVSTSPPMPREESERYVRMADEAERLMEERRRPRPPAGAVQPSSISPLPRSETTIPKAVAADAAKPAQVLQPPVEVPPVAAPTPVALPEPMVVPTRPPPPPPLQEVSLTTEAWITDELLVKISSTRRGDSWLFERTTLDVTYLGHSLKVEVDLHPHRGLKKQRGKITFVFGRTTRVLSFGFEESASGLRMRVEDRLAMAERIEQIKNDEGSRFHGTIARTSDEAKQLLDGIDRLKQVLAGAEPDVRDLITELDTLRATVTAYLNNLVPLANDYIDVAEHLGSLFADYRQNERLITEELGRIAAYRLESEGVRREIQAALEADFFTLVEQGVPNDDPRWKDWNRRDAEFREDSVAEEAKLKRLADVERRLIAQRQSLLGNLRVNPEYAELKLQEFERHHEALRTRVESARGRLPVIQRTFGFRVEALARAKAHAEARDGGKVDTPYPLKESYVQGEGGDYEKGSVSIHLDRRDFRGERVTYATSEMIMSRRGIAAGNRQTFPIQVFYDQATDRHFLITWPRSGSQRRLFVVWQKEGEESRRLNEIRLKDLPEVLAARLYLRDFVPETTPATPVADPFLPSRTADDYRSQKFQAPTTSERIEIQPRLRGLRYRENAGDLILAGGKRHPLTLVQRPGEIPENFYVDPITGRWFLETYRDTDRVLFECPAETIHGILDWILFRKARHAPTFRLKEKEKPDENETRFHFTRRSGEGDEKVTIVSRWVRHEKNWRSQFSPYGLPEGMDLPMRMSAIVTGDEEVIPSQAVAGPKKDIVFHVPYDPTDEQAYIQVLGPLSEGPFLIPVKRAEVPIEQLAQMPRRVFNEEAAEGADNSRQVTFGHPQRAEKIVLAGQPRVELPTSLNDFDFRAALKEEGRTIDLIPFVFSTPSYAPLFLATPDGQRLFMLCMVNGHDSFQEFDRESPLERDLRDLWLSIIIDAATPDAAALVTPATANLGGSPSPGGPVPEAVVIRRRAGEPDRVIAPQPADDPDRRGGSDPSAFHTNTIAFGNVVLKVEPELSWTPAAVTPAPPADSTVPTVLIAFLRRCEALAAHWGLTATRNFVRKIVFELARGRDLSGILISSKEVLKRLEKMPAYAPLVSRLRESGVKLKPEEALLLYWAVRFGREDDLARMVARLGVEPGHPSGVNAGALQGLSPVLQQGVRSPVFILK